MKSGSKGEKGGEEEVGVAGDPLCIEGNIKRQPYCRFALKKEKPEYMIKILKRFFFTCE